MRVVSLFSGIGALDAGLEAGGGTVVQMCESWDPARQVLQDRFAGVPLAGDVQDFSASESFDLLAAGFPCTNISHVGDRSGLTGPASGLVSHVFRVAGESRPDWILLENVPNIRTLNKGSVMRSIIASLESLGYQWAYRTVDSRFTGVPQRRPRVLFLASLVTDPAPVLLGVDAGPPTGADDGSAAGFYWTEGRNGTGLVWGAVPTLKGGSTIGLGSSPAVWLRDAPRGQQLVTLTADHGELLQGLPSGWTAAAANLPGPDMRWKLVGNAVTTGVSRWLMQQVRAAAAGSQGSPTTSAGALVTTSGSWPRAASGGPGTAPRASEVSMWPQREPSMRLVDVIAQVAAPLLSSRAAAGFLSRLDASGLPFDDELRAALKAQAEAGHARAPKTANAAALAAAR